MDGMANQPVTHLQTHRLQNEARAGEADADKKPCWDEHHVPRAQQEACATRRKSLCDICDISFTAQ